MFLQAVGNILAQNLLDTSINVLFWGVFIGLWVLACLSLLNRSFVNSWARWALLAALLVTVLTSVVFQLFQFTADFAIVAAHLNSWQAPVAVNIKTAPFDIASDWPQQISLLTNDIVVIWRAWVLYRDRPIVLFSLCLIFCATVATSFASLALVSQISISKTVSPSGISFRSSMAETLNNFATVLSFTTNLFATTLILIRLWKHRRFMDHSGFHHNSLTPSQRIMLFLVEAGFIFCIGV